MSDANGTAGAVMNVNTREDNIVVAQPMALMNRSSYWTAYNPTDAAQILEHENFARQRPVRPFHVKFLANLMRSGEFQPSEIKFAVTPDGQRHLINGQHRLHAIIESGRTQSLLCTQVPAHNDEHLARLYAAEDRILGRSIYDTFNAFGLSEELNLSRTVASRAVSAVALILNGFSRTDKGRWSDVQRMQGLRDWAKEIRLWGSIVGAPTGAIGDIGRMNNGPVMAVGLVTLRYQEEMAATFWRIVRANDGLRQGTPERTLADYITVKMPKGGGSSQSFVSSRYIARCWNAYFEGRLHARALPGDTTKPILIAGTPYTGEAVILPADTREVPF